MALTDLLDALAADGTARAELALAEARRTAEAARARLAEEHQARLRFTLEARERELRDAHRQELATARREGRRRVLEARAALLDRVYARAEARLPDAAAAQDTQERAVRLDRSPRTALRRRWPALRILVTRAVTEPA